MHCPSPEYARTCKDICNGELNMGLESSKITAYEMNRIAIAKLRIWVFPAVQFIQLITRFIFYEKEKIRDFASVRRGRPTFQTSETKSSF